MRKYIIFVDDRWWNTCKNAAETVLWLFFFFGGGGGEICQIKKKIKEKFKSNLFGEQASLRWYHIDWEAPVLHEEVDLNQC